MDIILGAFFFLLGTAVGSFVNVVSLRYHTGRSISTGRSACFSCAKSLPWYDLVPVVSFFALRGHCRFCGSALSLQYPAVEILSGFLFLGVFLKYSALFEVSLFYFLLSTFYFSVVIGLLMVILIYDIRHKIIPNAFVYPLIALSLLGAPIMSQSLLDLSSPYILYSIFYIIAAGFGMAAPIAALWLFSRGRAMGLGDAKLALALGFLLGPLGALSAFLLSFWIGAVAGIFLLTAPSLFGTRLRFTMKSEIPFAPFLILGFFLVFFFEINVLQTIFLWNV